MHPSIGAKCNNAESEILIWWSLPFSILFFLLCLGNCGAPLTLNFIGEFMSLYGVFERLPLLGLIASSSIVFSAAYTIYMFNRIGFGGSFSKFFKENINTNQIR